MTVVIEGAEVVLAIWIVIWGQLVERPNALEDGSLVIDRQVGDGTGKEESSVGEIRSCLVIEAAGTLVLIRHKVERVKHGNGGRPEEGARLLWVRRQLLPPSKPQTPDERIGRAPLQPQGHVFRADAFDYQARTPQPASLALTTTVPAIPAAATAFGTGRHPPVMILAFVSAAVAIGHSHMPRSP